MHKFQSTNRRGQHHDDHDASIFMAANTQMKIPLGLQRSAIDRRARAVTLGIASLALTCVLWTLHCHSSPEGNYQVENIGAVGVNYYAFEDGSVWLVLASGDATEPRQLLSA